MSAKGGKFGALGRLGGVTPKPEAVSPASGQEIQQPRKQETEERWEALGTEVRRETKRRLKAYAGHTGQKMKELVDAAINAYLDAHPENDR